jgi:O-antigen ligase
LVKLIVVLTLIGTVLAVMWLMGFGHLFQAHEEDSGELVDSIYFIGLLTSHTGAGAFWATVAAFLVGFAWSRRNRPLQVVAVLAILLIIGTGGRAATLGILGALAWLLVRGEILQKRTMLVGSLTLILSGAGAIFLGSMVPEISERMAEMLSAEAFNAVAAMVDEEPLDDPTSYFVDGSDLPHHNLVIRVYLWKYAINLFRKSPLIGIGFARYNDTDLDYVGIPHVAQLAVGGEPYYGSGIRWENEQKMTSTGNAHNSYLHILAETGLIGLVLFMILWVKMFLAVQPGPKTSPDDFARAYAVGCQAMIVCLAIGALAGHALGAPSGGILLTTMIGAWVSFKSEPSAEQAAAPTRHP